MSRSSKRESVVPDRIARSRMPRLSISTSVNSISNIFDPDAIDAILRRAWPQTVVSDNPDKSSSATKLWSIRFDDSTVATVHIGLARKAVVVEGSLGLCADIAVAVRSSVPSEVLLQVWDAAARALMDFQDDILSGDMREFFASV